MIVTAIICVAQLKHGLLHVLTDAALYRDGAVVSFANKSAPLPQWPGIVTATGSAFNTILFRAGLAEKFATWDEMIAGAEGELPQMVKDYGMSWSTVVLAGISKERGPEIYQFSNDALLPAHISQAEVDACPYFGEPYKLMRLPDTIMTPPVSAETVIAANFEGIDVEADPELVTWSMRKHLAMQRAMPLPDGVGGIGGFAELTTVSAEGVTQCVIERWPEDKVGAPLHHGPIDWTQWHADNPKPGMSRLRRDMAARKASKLQLV
jgi:hypothetical protein